MTVVRSDRELCGGGGGGGSDAAESAVPPRETYRWIYLSRGCDDRAVTVIVG